VREVLAAAAAAIEVRSCPSGLTRRRAARLGLVFGFAVLLLAGGAVEASAQTTSSSLVRTIDTSRWVPASPDPSGLDYDAARSRLLVSDGEVDEMSIYADANYYEASLSGVLLRTDRTTGFSDEPVGLAFNSLGRTYFADDDQREVFEVTLGVDGEFDRTDPVRSFDTAGFGCGDPEGLSYDPAGQRLFIADGSGGEIWIVSAVDGVLGNADDQISHFDTSRVGASDPEAVEFNPAQGTVYTITSSGDEIIELTTTGTVVSRIDVSYLPLMHPAGLVLAPRSTDSSKRSLYIADRKIDNNDNPSENDGAIYEITAPSSTTPPPPPPPPDGVLDVRVAASSDDSEEAASGSVSNSSSDLELVEDGSDQTVGMRFAGLGIPAGARITNAYVQFTADESHSGATSLTIRGQAADNAATFSSSSRNISSRARTDAFASWSPPAWTTGQAGEGQRTPNLSSLVQEIVDRPGWKSGQALALIVTGSGHRAAVAYDGSAAQAPLLHVEWDPPSGENTAPRVNAGPDQTVTLPAGATLDGTVADDGRLLSSPRVTWSKTSGPGTVTFANPAAVDTRASFSQVGTYVLRLTADDGALVADDELTVEVVPEPPPSLDVRVAASNDDAEESPTGSVSRSSSDLELVTDGSIVQTIGMRFVGVGIPAGAQITNAYVQFTSDRADSGGTSLTIRGQDADNAAGFTSSNFNVSSRARTGAFASWSPTAWASGEAGVAQRTPNLSTLVQEIIDRPGWNSGQALALIVTGSGRRVARSYNGSATSAPLLHVEWR
jgi:hypothetical protein